MLNNDNINKALSGASSNDTLDINMSILPVADMDFQYNTGTISMIIYCLPDLII